MPTSLVHDGKVLDWHFKSLGDTWHYAFYCGDIYMGQVFKMGKGDWTAVPKTPTNWAPYHGFRSRYHACELILKINGYDGNYPGKVYVYDEKTKEAAAEMVEEYGLHASKMGIANFSVLARKIRLMTDIPPYAKELLNERGTASSTTESRAEAKDSKPDSSREDGD